MGIGHLGSLDHLLVRSRGTAEQDVALDRVVEQHCLLRHHAHACAQRVLRIFAYRDSVEEHLSRGGVVEARDELAERRLAAARGADEGYRLALAYVDRDVVDYFARAVVGEVHAVETYRLLQAAELAGVLLVAHLALGVDDREYAFAGGDTLIDIGELVDERAQRTRDLRECGDERYEACGRQCAAARDDQVAAVDQNDAHGDDAQKLAHGRGQLLAPRHRYHQTREVGVDAPELLDQIVGRVVALDDLYARQRLVEHAYHVAHALLSALCGVAQALNDIAYDKTHDRQEQHRE